MIGNVGAAGQATYSSASRRAAPSAETRTASAAPSDQVDLSPGGKLLSDLPPLILDPKVHMANAEARLKELMTEMGIPPNTSIDIHLSNSGHFTVEGDSEKLTALQDRLNDGSEMKLRNALIGAHTGATIQRIAAASQRTQQQVAANPQDAEALWNAMLAEAERVKSQSMDFAFSGGALSGSFADGSAVAIA